MMFYQQCIKKERIGEKLNAHYETIIELEKRKKESEKVQLPFFFVYPLQVDKGQGIQKHLNVHFYKD